MSPTRLFGFLAFACAVTFIVAVVVVNASCHGDFECGTAGHGAWTVMVLSAGAGIVCLLAAALSAIRRSR